MSTIFEWENLFVELDTKSVKFGNLDVESAHNGTDLLEIDYAHLDELAKLVAYAQLNRRDTIKILEEE